MSYFGHQLEFYKGVLIFANFDEHEATCCCSVSLSSNGIEGEADVGYLAIQWNSDDNRDIEEEWDKLHFIARHWIDCYSNNWCELQKQGGMLNFG